MMRKNYLILMLPFLLVINMALGDNNVIMGNADATTVFGETFTDDSLGSLWTNTTGICGNGSCDSNETCSNCAVDCGSCPVTTVSVEVVPEQNLPTIIKMKIIEQYYKRPDFVVSPIDSLSDYIKGLDFASFIEDDNLRNKVNGFFVRTNNFYLGISLILISAIIIGYGSNKVYKKYKNRKVIKIK